MSRYLGYSEGEIEVIWDTKVKVIHIRKGNNYFGQSLYTSTGLLHYKDRLYFERIREDTKYYLLLDELLYEVPKFSSYISHLFRFFSHNSEKEIFSIVAPCTCKIIRPTQDNSVSICIYAEKLEDIKTHNTWYMEILEDNNKHLFHYSPLHGLEYVCNNSNLVISDNVDIIDSFYLPGSVRGTFSHIIDSGVYRYLLPKSASKSEDIFIEHENDIETNLFNKKESVMGKSLSYGYSQKDKEIICSEHSNLLAVRIKNNYLVWNTIDLNCRMIDNVQFAHLRDNISEYCLTLEDFLSRVPSVSSSVEKVLTDDFISKVFKPSKERIPVSCIVQYPINDSHITVEIYYVPWEYAKDNNNWYIRITYEDEISFFEVTPSNKINCMPSWKCLELSSETVMSSWIYDILDTHRELLKSFIDSGAYRYMISHE